MQPVVTVGLDGSPESLAAARWAAEEAEKRGLALRLLHAWPLLAPEPADTAAEVDQNYWARRLVHTAQAELRARHPDLTVVGDLVPEDAQEALIRAASESEMLVLGSRGWRAWKATSWATSACRSSRGPIGPSSWSARNRLRADRPPHRRSAWSWR